MAVNLLPYMLFGLSILAATVADDEIDIDGDGEKDVKVHNNAGNNILLFSNQVFRNGIKKITENVDISQLDNIKRIMENDNIMLKRLKAFTFVKKYDLGKVSIKIN